MGEMRLHSPPQDGGNIDRQSAGPHQILASAQRHKERIGDIPVALKVAVAPLTAIVCLMLVGALGIWGSLALINSMEVMRNETLPSLTSMSELQRRLATVVATTNQSLAWTGAAMPAERINLVDKEASAELQAIGRQIADEAGRGIYDDDVRARLTKLAGSYKNFQLIAMELLDLKRDGLSLAAPFLQQLLETYKSVDLQIAALSESLRQASEFHVGQASASASTKMMAIAATSLLALVICAFVAWWSARLIVQPLKEAKSLAAEIASGNIVVRRHPSSKDETGQVLGALVSVAGSLNHMVSDIRGAAFQIDAAAGEISNGNSDLSVRTERNATALQAAARSVDHLASMVRQSADKAREVNINARDTSQVAELGGAMVEDLVMTMEALNTQAKRIAEIISTIDGIAFQTNILALNAAVEAARAGNQGRGFAVVAKEVRSLAASSADAAREIRGLIGHSVASIGEGARKAQEAGQTVKRVVHSVKDVAHTIVEISRAANEQAAEISRFSATVVDMDRSTQENAALVEEASAATMLLRRQAKQLVESISRFQVD